MFKLDYNIKCALISISVLVSVMTHASNYKDIRAGLDAYLETKNGKGTDFIYLREWGFHTNKEYINFAMMVSNDYKNVFANINSIATNETERLLVFGVGWQFGEEFYLLCLEELADLGLKGYLTPYEMLWYRYSDFNVNYPNILRLRCRESRIKKLVRKLMCVEPEKSEYYGKILSGESYEESLEDRRAGLWN